MLASPLSELDAINSMLIAIGEAPVNAITPTLRDQNLAAKILGEVVREINQYGFRYNTDESYVLHPTANGIVFAPVGALNVEPMDTRLKMSARHHPEHSQPAIWDHAANSFEIGVPVSVRVKWSWSFEALPESARSYAVAAASRRFQAQTIGDPAADRMAQDAEARSWLVLLKEQTANANTNVFRANGRLAAQAMRRGSWRVK